MSDVTINTWRDLLFPNDQDARVSLLRIDRTRGQDSTAKTSSLSNPGIVPNQLPSNAYVVPNLPERMSEHLEILLDRHYSVQAATTSFTEGYSESLTPKGVFQSLQRNARNVNFRLNYEPGSSSIGPYLFSLVQIIYQALTESPRLSFDTEVHGPGDHVIGDFTYLIDNRITILVENKSPKVFDRFIGQFMEQGRDGRPISLCSESVATSYEGYKAIFGKVRIVVSDLSVVSLSDSSLPLAWVPCEWCSTPGPLGNRVQWTLLRSCLHPAPADITRR